MTLCLGLPQLVPALFGWLVPFSAVPVYLLVRIRGMEAGVRNVATGLAAAAAAAWIGGGSLLGYIQLLPLVGMGLSLCDSATRGDSPWMAGCKGYGVFWLTWAGIGAVIWLGRGVNLYQGLLEGLDKAFLQALELYRQENSFSAETLAALERLVETARTRLPVVLPAFLAAGSVLLVWANLGAANGLAARFQPRLRAWPPFTCWRLPEGLVWLLIVGGFGLVLGVSAANPLWYLCLAVSGAFYLIQGAGVLAYFLDRWQAPRFFRFFLYLALIVQSYSLFFLAGLGVAETWLDLRRLGPRGTADPAAKA